MNTLNKYNQNFKGLYCSCHRPYPDPEDEVRFSSTSSSSMHISVPIPLSYSYEYVHSIYPKRLSVVLCFLAVHVSLFQ